jgi:hypothetical protein
VTVLRADPPAELILIEGEPSLTPISGTSLMFVKNTEQDLFLHRAEGLYYYLTSGRWFRARQLKGPWAAVGDDLPGDFSRIPEEHPKSDALAAVPGTPQAKEAVIEAQIPKKITVKRKEAAVKVQYSGKPQFEPVQGTSMAYAVNTMNDVIKVKEQYYCCFQGVWFVASAPEGPWKVCDAVPKEIYTIPPSHPKHFVTYVFVYGADAETVTFGYTAGYTGVYISNGTVVYGSGYPYTTQVYYVAMTILSCPPSPTGPGDSVSIILTDGTTRIIPTPPIITAARNTWRADTGRDTNIPTEIKARPLTPGLTREPLSKAARSRAPMSSGAKA